MKWIIGIGIVIVVAVVLFFAWVLCRAASDWRDRKSEGRAYPSEQVPVTIGQIKSCETLKEISDVRKED